MELRTLIISLLLISGIMIGTGVFYTGLATNYGKTVTDISNYEQTKQTYQKIQNMYNAMPTSSEQQISGFSFILTLPITILNAVVNVVLMFLAIPEQFIFLINNFLYIINAPSWFVEITKGIIFITVILAIAGLFLKGRV